MFNKRTAQGVSFAAEFSDYIAFTLNIGYNFHKGNAFSLYGENVFLLIQTIAVIYGISCFGSFKMSKFFGLLVLTVVWLFAYFANIIPEYIYVYNIYILIAICKNLSNNY